MRGEVPACDTETIRRTPSAFLTRSQKDLIKQDYQRRCAAFDGYAWIHNGEKIADGIIRELMVAYLKNADDIQNIVGMTDKESV